MNPTRILALSASMVLLSACGTPPAALDQANNGAMLGVALQSELRHLRTVQAGVAQQRVDSVRRLRSTMAGYEVDAAFDDRVQRAAGNTSGASLATTLRELADSKAQDEVDLKAKLAAIDDALAKLLSPVPEQSAKLGETQAAMAALGQELSLQERVKVVADFSKELRDRLKTSREAAKAATAAVPASPAGQGAAPAGVGLKKP